MTQKKKRKPGTERVPGGRRREALARYVRTLPPDALRDLVLEARRAVPAFAAWLEEKRVLEGREQGEMAARVERLIAAMPAEPDYGHPWERYGESVDTDYGAIRRAMEALLEAGGADELLALVPDLLERGGQEVELHHHHDGIGYEIESCLEIAWRALQQSRLTPSEQVLFAIDLDLADEYGLVPDIGKVARKYRKKAVWSKVADALHDRMEALAVPEGEAQGSEGYRRRKLVDARVDALDRAGRAKAAEAVRACEAQSAGAWDEWVRRLLADGRPEEAERRALEGLAATERPERMLHDLMLEAVAAQRAWTRLAALRAERFRSRPSMATYDELLDAAGKARVKRVVRKGALAYLEANCETDSEAPTGLERDAAGLLWGLPAVPDPARLPATSAGRLLLVRLEIALADGKPEEILAFHDRVRERRRTVRWFGNRGDDLLVAKAVQATHPARALEFYAEAADAVAAQKNPDVYAEVARHLKAMRPLYRRLGRTGDWKTHVEALRAKYSRKWRLGEVLDGVLGKPPARPRRARRTRR